MRVNKNEDGMVLITILFFMLILVLIGIGISSISNIGLENSVIEKKIEEQEAVSDGLVNIVKDDLLNPNENPENYSKMEVHIFIDNEAKEFTFDIMEELTNGAISINMDEGSDWKIDYFKKGIEDINYTLTSDAINLNYKKYTIDDSLLKTDNTLEKDYKIKLKSDKVLNNMQYKLIIRAFYK